MHLHEMCSLQVGVVNFQPYKQLFLSSFAHSRTSFPGAPNLPSIFAYPARNYRTAQLKDQLPALGIKLNHVMDRLKVSCKHIFRSLFLETKWLWLTLWLREFTFSTAVQSNLSSTATQTDFWQFEGKLQRCWTPWVHWQAYCVGRRSQNLFRGEPVTPPLLRV